MARSQPYIFVLWGNRFEEANAALFVVELRKAGLRVKVIGLNGRQSKGAHGLTLAPDLILGQSLSLAGRTTCLIFPCSYARIRHLIQDPRLTYFVRQAQSNGARFVVAQECELHQDRPETAWLFTANLIFYPEGEELLPFIHELGDRLGPEPR